MRFVSMKSSRASKSGATTSYFWSLTASPSDMSFSAPLWSTLVSHLAMSRTPPENVSESPTNFSRGRPCSARTILPTSQIARTSMLSLLTSCIAGSPMSRPAAPVLLDSGVPRLPWNLASWRSNSVPTFPVPMMPTAMVVSDSVKPSWAARSARPSSSRSTTAEMLRSEEPCAMAMTFTLARPRALKKLPPTPVRFFMPSPMTARMLTLSR
mmetsp:Transcript_3956/g.10683  ORF Transcript_3956/g.10683 Transcript_3956/m.10683 type:complete len:211 (+) Transcript_3956:917-1549(+)